MFERYDESELLSLIEGELDQRAVASLQLRLADDPQARATILAMAQDRLALRAAPEPALPMDFLAQIEPMRARPMLMDPVAEVVTLKPGEFRRQHRRANRRWRLGRLAAAAAILLLVFGGAWAMIDGLVLNHSEGDDSERLARGSDSPSDDGLPAPGELARATPGDPLVDRLGPGVVHHDRPPADITRFAAASSAATPTQADRSAEPAGDANPIIVVDFAIVLNAREAADIEAAMSRVVASLGERGALVKNFSFDEAQRLAEAYRVAHGGPVLGTEADATVASAAAGDAGHRTPGALLSRSDVYRLAQRVRDQLREQASRADGAVADTASATGGVVANGSTRLTRADASVDDGAAATVAGPAALGPTLEQQLDFSSRGATYTIAVPAAEVGGMIERLSLKEGQPTMLQMLPAPPALDEVFKPAAGSAKGDSGRRDTTRRDAPADPPSTLVWLTEGPRVRQAMSRLSQARDGAIVLVPVIVK